MGRSRSTVLAGIGAALLCNYWVLESVLAKRSDTAASWISDLGARSEAFGRRFDLLEVAAGLAIAAFALLLRARSDDLVPGAGRGGAPNLLRRGALALAASGLFTAIGGAAPLSCAEALDPSCSPSYDALDVIHAGTNVGAVISTALAFGLIGLGLERLPGRGGAGRTTLAIGSLWLLLVGLTGLSYLNGDLDSVKGIFQRGEEILLGCWLVLLGVWAGGNRRLTSTGPKVRGSAKDLRGEDTR